MKDNSSLKNLVIFFVFAMLLNVDIHSQDLKKELTIPFPISAEISDSEKVKKVEIILPPEKKPEKPFIRIPFPDDKQEVKSPPVEFKDKKPEIPELEKSNKTLENLQLPLEKLFVYPELEKEIPINNNEKKPEVISPDKKTEESKTVQPPEQLIKPNKKDKEVKSEPSEKITHDVGKALVTGEGKSETSKSLTTSDKEIGTESKVVGLDPYTNKTPTKITKKEPKPETKAVEKKPELPSKNIPETKLPNSDKPAGKKGKDKKVLDESGPPFERSKYHINRDDKPSAVPELNTASSGDGEKSNLAKMDQIRLLAMERKKNEAKNLIEGITEPEFRFKGLYELAVGLENSAKENKKQKEEAIPFHLSIITEAPKTDSIVPKSLWALSHLLFTIGDHTPALDHLSEIILNHPNSEFADDAIYLSGRIYEESPEVRNLIRAKKYYKIFLKNESKKHFKNSMYLPLVKKRLEMLGN